MKLSLEQSLYKAGLDDKEAAIYSLLLKEGGATPSQIATSTKINRSTVYKALLRLSIKGLVGETTKGKKRYYFAEKPTKLKNFKKGQVRTLEREMSYLEDLMPRLSELYGDHGNTTKALYFEGDEVRKIYDDHISYENYELLGIVDTNAILTFSPDYSYWKTYISTKVRNKISTRGIMPDTTDMESILQTGYKNTPRWAQPKMRTLPESFFAFEGEYIIYGPDRVSMTNLKEGKLSGVIIVDATFRAMMANFFELIWQTARD